MKTLLLIAAGVLAGAAIGLAVGTILSRRTVQKLRARVTALKAGQPEQETNTSNLILKIVAAFLLTFIVTMVAVFCVKGAVPDTLIQYTMGAGGVEAVILAAIKISKIVKGSKQETDETGIGDEAG